jgi:hypothetical protein
VGTGGAVPDGTGGELDVDAAGATEEERDHPGPVSVEGGSTAVSLVVTSRE